MDEFSAQLVKEMKRLRRYALSLSRNPDRADDLAQETLARAIEKEHLFERGTNLGGWLSTICRNIFLTENRKIGRIVNDPEDVFASTFAGNDDQLGALEAKDAISFIIELPPDCQRVLMLRSFGMSYEQMAEELGVPDGTIKSRVHRGRVMLAELIGQPELMATSEVSA